MVLMVILSKTVYATHCMTQVCCSQSSFPQGRPLLTHASAEDTQTLKGRSGSVYVCSLGPGAHKALSPQASLMGRGLDSQRDFATPTILLGLLFCP